MRRVWLVLMLPLIALDCLGNLLIGGSWRNTMSGEAWHHRGDEWTGWTYRFIDWLFFWQANHCQRQAVAEAFHGSVWRAWLAAWTKPTVAQATKQPKD